MPVHVPAPAFITGIRGACGLEMLHSIQDGRFWEDKSKLGKEHSPSKMSVLDNIAINVFRHLGSQSLASSMGQIAHAIKGLALIILE